MKSLFLSAKIKKGLYHQLRNKFYSQHSDSEIKLTERQIFGLDEETSEFSNISIRQQIINRYEEVFKNERPEDIISKIRTHSGYYWYNLKASKGGEVSLSKIECIGLYLLDDYDFKADFLTCFKEVMSMLLELLEIEDDEEYQITKKESKACLKIIDSKLNKQLQDAEDYFHAYDFYYYSEDNKKIEKFEGRISYGDGKTGRVEMDRVPSKHAFTGVVKFHYDVGTSMELESKHRSVSNKRVLYIIVKDQQSNFKDFPITGGVYANIGKDANPTCGAIILRKRALGEKFKQDEIPSAIKAHLLCNSKSITIKEVAGSMSDFERSLSRLYRNWTTNLSILENMKGAYYNYVITKDKQILKSCFSIKKDGSICDYKLDNETDKKEGDIRIITPKIFQITLRNEYSSMPEFTIIGRVQDGGKADFFKAIYAGRYENTLLKAGRCLLQRYRHKENEPIITSTPKEINFFSDEHKKLIEEIPDFNTFFCNGKNRFINTNSLYDNILKYQFPWELRPDVLSKLKGVYTYYRQSKRYPNKIKKYPMCITAQGTVDIKASITYKGNILIVGDLLYMHTFYDDVSNNNKAYGGMSIFNIAHLNENNEQKEVELHGLFLGVSKHSENTPLAWRVIAKKVPHEFNALEKEIYDLKEIDLSDFNETPKTKNILKRLIGSTSFITCHKDLEIEATKETCTTNFYAACFLINESKKFRKKGNKEKFNHKKGKALEYIEKAFASDFSATNQLITEYEIDKLELFANDISNIRVRYEDADDRNKKNRNY